MRLKVFTLTTDGDNCGLDVEVHATEEQARASLIAGLESFGVQRARDGHKLASASIEELCELWEDAADGHCSIEEHTVELAMPGVVVQVSGGMAEVLESPAGIPVTIRDYDIGDDDGAELQEDENTGHRFLETTICA